MRYEIHGIKLKPKARPRGNGRVMFMPPEYMQWKGEVRRYLADHYKPAPLLGPVGLSVEVHGPNRPRGDMDNLIGGLMDALQPPRAKGDVRAQRQLEAVTTIEERLAASPGCLYGDDAQVVALSIRWVKGRKRLVVLEVQDLSDELAG